MKCHVRFYSCSGTSDSACKHSNMCVVLTKGKLYRKVGLKDTSFCLETAGYSRRHYQNALCIFTETGSKHVELSNYNFDYFIFLENLKLPSCMCVWGLCVFLFSLSGNFYLT